MFLPNKQPKLKPPIEHIDTSIRLLFQNTGISSIPGMINKLNNDNVFLSNFSIIFFVYILPNKDTENG
jgi:hypothetical protein